VGISPIFNIADLYPYKEDRTEGSEDQRKIQWEKQMPVAEKLQMEKIIDQRVGKKTRRKTYFEYLVKWKGRPVEDAVGLVKQRSRSMEDRCRSSWTGVHEFFSQGSMMQEHRQQSTSGRQLGALAHILKCF
jgi:hypothetical protein